jgi:hypothetical protein
MNAQRRGGFRGGFSRWDRRDVGLKPENALSRAERKCSSPRGYEILVLPEVTLAVILIYTRICLFSW